MNGQTTLISVSEADTTKVKKELTEGEFLYDTNAEVIYSNMRNIKNVYSPTIDKKV